MVHICIPNSGDLVCADFHFSYLVVRERRRFEGISGYHTDVCLPSSNIHRLRRSQAQRRGLRLSRCASAEPPITSSEMTGLTCLCITVELGHGIHDLLSRTKYSRFHGWQSPPDFAEIPSVMLENWCWMKHELKKMSRHYTTLDPGYLEAWLENHPGETAPQPTIPDELLDGLVAGRNQHQILQLLDQL